MLGDVGSLGQLLAPLLDADASRLAPPDPRWHLPRIGLGSRTFDVVLDPRVQRDESVELHATSTTGSDLAVDLLLVMGLGPVGPSETEAVVAWELDVELALPRPLLLLARRAVDQIIPRVLHELTDRAVASVHG